MKNMIFCVCSGETNFIGCFEGVCEGFIVVCEIIVYYFMECIDDQVVRSVLFVELDKFYNSFYVIYAP